MNMLVDGYINAMINIKYIKLVCLFFYITFLILCFICSMIITQNLLKHYNASPSFCMIQQKKNILNHNKNFILFLNFLFSQKNMYNYKLKSFSESETLDYGITFKILKNISIKNFEPAWTFQFRNKSLNYFSKMNRPAWSECSFVVNDFSKMIFYSAILKSKNLFKKSIDNNTTDSDTKTAVDLVVDSISIETSFQRELSKHGVIFVNLSSSIKNFPDLISNFLGGIVSNRDNYYAALNSAVFSEGSFVYIPKNLICPLDLSTYFRINGNVIGQFERTLIIAENNSKVSYLEGCTAPFYSTNQLHAAVVELLTFKNAIIKYSTVQNWYPGDVNGIGGIYNFVTKRGLCLGDFSKISWTQVETGSSLTWKYPSVILKGLKSAGEFYSIAITKLLQKADTGSKMIHIGCKTSSKIVSKGLSLENSNNCYRGLVYVHNNSKKSRNNTQCDSILFGQSSSANTYPYIIIKDSSAWLEHEASVAKVEDDQLFFLQQRGLTIEESLNLILGGFCKDVVEELPFEFLTEVNELMNATLFNKIG
uniref:Fe-S cluster assembly protein SufB n=1 Tax=Lotharella vacuolata TaxID=74820 RepID=A0A0H5BHJ2_9EUKA|nr:Fe-S cluster assembly protein SufB [Lotharella vacuolata]